jgi:hypothetical protein
MDQAGANEFNSPWLLAQNLMDVRLADFVVARAG